MEKYSKKAGEKLEKKMHEMTTGDLPGRTEKKGASSKQSTAMNVSGTNDSAAKAPKKRRKLL